jgi:hypothetical protein
MATVIESNVIMIYWWERKLILTVVIVVDPVYRSVFPAGYQFVMRAACTPGLSASRKVG